jgi:hypothetical protein
MEDHLSRPKQSNLQFRISGFEMQDSSDFEIAPLDARSKLMSLVCVSYDQLFWVGKISQRHRDLSYSWRSVRTKNCKNYSDKSSFDGGSSPFA